MSRPLRLAVFATHPIQYHAPWFRALVAEGVDLHVFFSILPDAAQQAVGFGGEFRWDVPILEGYRWSVLPQARRKPVLGGFFGIRSRGVGRALAEMAPDAVVVTGWNALPLLQAAWAAVRLGIPRVVRGESNALRPRARWKLPVHRALMSLFESFVSIGKANRAFYEANGVPSSMIFDGGYFVDNELFGRMEGRDVPRRAELRRNWGIPEGAVCFVLCAKLQSKKRPLDFLEAVGRASSRLGPEAVHALVVGSGEMEAEMRGRAEAARVPVTFAGFLNQTELGRAYAAADVLVLPSDFGETWGLVVNEGMLFGLPVIASDRVGCVPDLVSHGDTGFVFGFGNVEELAQCMVSMANDPDQRARMGASARLRIQLFTPARGAHAVVLAALAAGARGG